MADSQAQVPVKSDAAPSNVEPRPDRWHPLSTLRREIDRLFDDFDGWPRWRPLTRSLSEYPAPLSLDFPPIANPKVDFVETDKGWEITAELPGMDEKNVEVTVNDSTLTIKGEKKDEREETKKGYHLSERRYGSFERRFRLPEGIERDRIDASFRKGVLTVTLPRTAQAQAPDRKVEVKAG